MNKIRYRPKELPNSNSYHTHSKKEGEKNFSSYKITLYQYGYATLEHQYKHLTIKLVKSLRILPNVHLTVSFSSH